MNPRQEMENLLSSVGIGKVSVIISRLNNKARDILLDGLNNFLNESKKQQLLAELRKVVNDADNDVKEWVMDAVPKAYVHGANYTTKNANIKAPVMTVELLKGSAEYSPHLNSVKAMMSDAYLDFGGAMNTFAKSSERILNDALKRQVRSQLLDGRYQGESIQKIKKTVKETFMNNGIVGLTDRNGRKWSLDRYSEMLTRTHIMRANNEAAINRAKELGLDIIKISVHNTECSICKPHEGKIYSLSGNDKRFPALTGNEPPYHPNCKHSIQYRPDLELEQ